MGATPTPTIEPEREMRCAFCGRGVDEVKRMIAKSALDENTLSICDACVRLCYAMLDDPGWESR